MKRSSDTNGRREKFGRKKDITNKNLSAENEKWIEERRFYKRSIFLKKQKSPSLQFNKKKGGFGTVLKISF